MHKFKTFIGIDISKNTLDIAIINQEKNLHQQIPNTYKEIKKFFRKIVQEADSALICMEHTGIYCHGLLTYFQEQKHNVWVVHPAHIKKSAGICRGKNDRIDALRIAQFAQRHQEDAQLWTPSRKVLNTLQHLMHGTYRYLLSWLISLFSGTIT